MIYKINQLWYSKHMLNFLRQIAHVKTYVIVNTGKILYLLVHDFSYVSYVAAIIQDFFICVM